MEFDEMQKIWDTQNNAPLYAINEQALHNRIITKMRKGAHITGLSEVLSIMANTLGGALILVINLIDQSKNIFMYLLSAWMFVIAVYLLANRIRRQRAARRFDRAMLSDLNQALSTARYQVWLSRMMRWNTIPISTLIVLGLWTSEKSVWVISIVLIFFIVVYYASGWEHTIYRNRQLELETLYEKLASEKSE